MQSHPHAAAPVEYVGAPLSQAVEAIVLLHGRGASAQGILPLADAITPSEQSTRLAFVAPQAVGSTWYPYSFLAPCQDNEPWLTSALQRINELVLSLNDAGISSNRIVIAGFSQGACLATEFVASYPMRYAGLVAFTGGLIGPPGANLSHTGSLEETPALLMSGDPDPHVPWQRVEESAAVLEAMGARVETMRFPGRAHTISGEEVQHAQRLIASVFAPTRASI